MSLRTRGCVNDTYNFCYICGSFIAKAQCQNVTRFVDNKYYVYFRIKLGVWDKAWAPHKFCHCCVESLY